MWTMPANAPYELIAVPGGRLADVPSGTLYALRQAAVCAATDAVFSLVELARMPAPTRRFGSAPAVDFALEDRDLVVVAHAPEEFAGLCGAPGARPSAAPLAGLCVVVTRAAHQALSLAEKLEAVGAEVTALPAIAIGAPADPSALDEALLTVEKCDAVIFTSENGVDRSFSRLRELGRDSRVFAGLLVAAIGPGTAAALARQGIRADCMPDEFVGEALARAVDARLSRGSRVRLFRATEARDALPVMLREAGHAVSVISAYTTLRAFDAARFSRLVRDHAGRAPERRVVVTFTSASTVRSVVEALEEAIPEALEDAVSGALPGAMAGAMAGATAGATASEVLALCTLLSIGPITSAELARWGLRATLEASPYTLDGLVSALVQPRS